MRSILVVVALVAALQLILADVALGLACRPIGGTTEAECKNKIPKW